MSRHGSEFVTTVATIAARAAKTRKVKDVEEAVSFAWFSVAERGDASIDDGDFQRHWTAWRLLNADAGDPEGREATRAPRKRPILTGTANERTVD